MKNQQGFTYIELVLYSSIVVIICQLSSLLRGMSLKEEPKSATEQEVFSNTRRHLVNASNMKYVMQVH